METWQRQEVHAVNRESERIRRSLTSTSLVESLQGSSIGSAGQ